MREAYYFLSNRYGLRGWLEIVQWWAKQKQIMYRVFKESIWSSYIWTEEFNNLKITNLRQKKSNETSSLNWECEIHVDDEGFFSQWKFLAAELKKLSSYRETGEKAKQKQACKHTIRQSLAGIGPVTRQSNIHCTWTRESKYPDNWGSVNRCSTELSKLQHRT